jgi:Protein of unknown function DUF104
MTMQIIRARAHAGRLEPLDEVALPEGQEFRVTLELVASTPEPAHPAPDFASWDLGTFQPLTRGDIYDDAG